MPEQFGGTLVGIPWRNDEVEVQPLLPSAPHDAVGRSGSEVSTSADVVVVEAGGSSEVVVTVFVGVSDVAFLKALLFAP